jgi:hypothetical protein
MNVAVGHNVLYQNTTGNYNTAVGSGVLGVTASPLANLTTGSYNTALGNSAMQATVTGNYNTAVGYAAGKVLTSGTENVYVGSGAGSTATTATGNTGVGNNALVLTTTGGANTAIGSSALNFNTTGTDNTAIGYQAGYSQTSGQYNTHLGRQAGYSATTGSNNTFVGVGSGYFVSTGAKNTVLGGYNGNQGSLDIRTASNYIVLSDGDGNPRGYFDNNGMFNVVNANTSAVCFKGYATNASFNGIVTDIWADRNTTNNSFLALRYYNVGAGQVKFQVEDSGSVNNRTGTYGTLSDVKLKENIVDATPKLDDLNKLQVRNFNFKGDADKQLGFIAQELEQVFPLLVSETPDKDKDGNDLGTVTKAVKTSILIPILVKAIQEQQAIINSLKARLDAANL